MTILLMAGPQGLSVGVSFSGDFPVPHCNDINFHIANVSPKLFKASYLKKLSVRFEPIRNREVFEQIIIRNIIIP